MLTDEQMAYLEAAQQELTVCPMCQTWLESECRNGHGCPYIDGMNGTTLKPEDTSHAE